MHYIDCNLCPRGCGVDRTRGETGFCGCADTALVAKSMLHRWEEPALAPGGKSGAIFFGGCTLKCSYCQNIAISCHPTGTPVDAAGFFAVGAVAAFRTAAVPAAAPATVAGAISCGWNFFAANIPTPMQPVNDKVPSIKAIRFIKTPSFFIKSCVPCARAWYPDNACYHRAQEC